MFSATQTKNPIKTNAAESGMLLLISLTVKSTLVRKKRMNTEAISR